jgi:hypothetical protein
MRVPKNTSVWLRKCWKNLTLMRKPTRLANDFLQLLSPPSLSLPVQFNNIFELFWGDSIPFI